MKIIPNLCARTSGLKLALKSKLSYVMPVKTQLILSMLKFTQIFRKKKQQQKTGGI